MIRGLRCVTIRSNTPGSTRLISHKTLSIGGVNISVNGLRYALPRELGGEFGAEEQDGPFPIPDTAGLRRINEVCTGACIRGSGSASSGRAAPTNHRRWTAARSPYGGTDSHSS